MAISSGVASQNEFIRRMFSLTPDPLEILLALDSFLSRPPTYESYRLTPSKSTHEYGISECDLTKSSRWVISFPSTVVATVDCDGVLLNSGLDGSEGFMLIEFPREKFGDTSRVCCNRPGASCSSLIDNFRVKSHRASDLFREGVPLVGLIGALIVPCFKS